MTTGAADPLAFTQLLLAVIDEGRRTATYKLAVLLALIDCCASASRWAVRPHDVLEQIQEETRWPLRLGESLGIARGLYAHLPDGTRLWSAVGVFTLLNRNRLVDLLPTLTPAHDG